MGKEDTGYVYRITVRGTDIREYYDLEEKLTEEQVADIWLSDACEGNGMFLESVFAGRVEVKLLTECEESVEEKQLEEEVIPLPPPDNDER